MKVPSSKKMSVSNIVVLCFARAQFCEAVGTYPQITTDNMKVNQSTHLLTWLGVGFDGPVWVEIPNNLFEGMYHTEEGLGYLFFCLLL